MPRSESEMIRGIGGVEQNYTIFVPSVNQQIWGHLGPLKRRMLTPNNSTFMLKEVSRMPKTNPKSQNHDSQGLSEPFQPIWQRSNDAFRGSESSTSKGESLNIPGINDTSERCHAGQDQNHIDQDLSGNAQNGGTTSEETEVSCMARPTNWEVSLREYIRNKRNRGVARKTIKDYRRALKNMYIRLSRKKGMETDPCKITSDEISYLREQWDAPKYDRWNLAILRGFLEYNENYIMTKEPQNLPEDKAVTKRWLNPEHMEALWDAVQNMSPVHRVVIFLEMHCELRRCEVIRLQAKDIDMSQEIITVRGKGRGGKPKIRHIPFFYPGTATILEEWSLERQKLIEEAQKIRPDTTIPEEFVIWRRYGTLGGCKRSVIDRIVKESMEQIGIGKGDRGYRNHCLRRSGSKWLAEEADVKIEVVSTILGHSKITTTQEYLGTDLKTVMKEAEKIKRKLGLIPKSKSESTASKTATV